MLDSTARRRQVLEIDYLKHRVRDDLLMAEIDRCESAFIALLGLKYLKDCDVISHAQFLKALEHVRRKTRP